MTGAGVGNLRHSGSCKPHFPQGSHSSNVVPKIWSAKVLLSLGDLSAGKRALKKAFLLGSQHPSDRDSVRRSLKYAIKGCHLEEALSELGDDDQQGALSLYEQLGDLYCKAGCFQKAVDYYRLQLRCAESLDRPERELAVIHVSLAATFSDLRDYKQALIHYRAELDLRRGNPREECKTWLNMALAQEEDAQDYPLLQNCLSNALRCAKEAGEVRLQRRVLRQLLAVQRKFGIPEVADTEAEVHKMCEGSDGDSSEEEMENSEPLQESDLELSQSDDEGDLEGYNKSVPGKRRQNRWNRRNEKGETVLHRACIDGNTKLVQCLLEKGHPLNPRDYCGWTPLHEACNHGHLEIVQLLLDRGANINDAGGPMCEGITPLHDALSSGNFHVAQLLIRRGASVTQRNVKGDSALGSLQEWIHVYGKHLDQDTRRICKETENLLREVLAGRVTTISLKPQDQPDHDLFDTEASQLPIASRSRHSQPESSVPRRGGPDRPKPLFLSHLGSRLGEKDKEVFLHGSPPLKTSTQLCPEESLYNKVSEQLLTPLKPVKKKTRFVGQRSSSDSAVSGEINTEALAPSFLSVQQARLSDGGIEAYQRAMKGLGSAKSRILNQSLEETTNIIPDSAPRVALVPSEEYLDDDWLEDDLQEMSRARKRVRHSPTSMESETESLHPEDEVLEEHPQGRERPADRVQSRKRSRQTKLTQIVDRAVVGRTKGSGQNNLSIPRMPGLNSSTDSILDTEALPATISIAPPPIRVRVRVQDNVFLIPIPHTDRDTLEVSWLVDQASQRYYQSCGLLPRLTLKKEGALLAPQDLILHVLQSNEEVLAEVNSWDLPPVTDRYRKACESLAVAEHRLVMKALEQQEMSSALSLCRLSLRPLDLCPLLRALKLQSSLRQLNLSGNVLGDAEMEELLAVLCTMPNITHLNLSHNRLTHEGIRKLSTAPRAVEGVVFKRLEVLDLSVNPLSDGLSQPLASLIRCCPVLSTVQLHSCQLSAKFMQQYRLQLADAFRGAIHLKTLSLSYNPLGSTGVELVLKTLPHDNISRLELRAVIAGSRESLMIEPFVRYLSQEGCALSHLSLSSNHLTDDSLRELSRCLPVCPSLTSLDLSGNTNVGVDGFEYLLSGIRERNSKMSDLDLTGCSIQGPLSRPSLGDLPHLLRELRLGSRGFTKTDRELLTQAWSGECLLMLRHHKLFFKSL
ncbi:tonsoku-like protein [Pelodytes ibericus]